MQNYDSIIIGAGPAGLSAAINLIQRNKSCVVLSSGANLLRRAEKVDNYLGMPNVTGGEMMDAFIAHAKALGAEIREGTAGNVFPFNGEFMVNFNSDVLTAKTIILASGIAKAKAIEGEERLLGHGVSYCATCDGMLYKGREVAVWGLSDEAVREAAFLNEIGCKVIFVAAKQPEGLAQGINYIKGSISKVSGEGAVSGITVGGTQYDVTGVFILRAAIAPALLLPGIETDDGYVIINSGCKTNIDGVFAAGDVTGKPLQVANAVGDGLIAALSAAEYLDSKLKGEQSMKRKDYISWDEYFMGVALLTAQRSKDNSSQVGACIVSAENKILSMGYNGMPIGCPDDEMPWERAGEPLNTKYLFVCHAELNAILNHAAGTGSLKGARVYTTLFPCNECAKAIIQSGIKRVIYYDDKYAESDSVIASKKMFTMTGVEFEPYNKTGRSVSVEL